MRLLAPKVLVMTMTFSPLVMATQKSTSALNLKGVKENIMMSDMAERQILGTLFTINQRMKDMSKKRDRLTNQLLGTQSDIKSIAGHIVNLEKRLANQRGDLKKAMREMYLLNNQGTLRIIFSAQSSFEFERNLKYLRWLSESSQKLIKNYENNLALLKRKRQQLGGKVQNLSQLQGRLKEQEIGLVEEQQVKGSLLQRLKKSREEQFKVLKTMRHQVAKQEEWDDFDTSFFERRGDLAVPVKGEKVKSYGFISDEKTKTHLAHKGVFFATEAPQPVNSVFQGKIAFAQEIPGYGDTIVIDHGDHYYSVMTYLTKIKVVVGEKIKEGQELGVSGGSSPWFGKGLYFEIRHFSDAIDPEPWFKKADAMKTSQL